MPRRTPPDPQLAAVLAWLDGLVERSTPAVTLPPATHEEQRLADMLARLPRTGFPLDLPDSDAVGLLP